MLLPYYHERNTLFKPNFVRPVTRGGKLKAKLDLGDGEISVRYTEGEFKLQHLPPIVLAFLLPENYPSSRSPIFRIESKWLTTKQVKTDVILVTMARTKFRTFAIGLIPVG